MICVCVSSRHTIRSYFTQQARTFWGNNFAFLNVKGWLFLREDLTAARQLDPVQATQTRLRKQWQWTGMMLLGWQHTMRIQSLWRYLCLIMPATPRWASELSCEHSHYPASHGLWPHATTGLCHCHFCGTGSSMGLAHHCPPVRFWSIWNILNETTFWASSKTHSQILGF